MDSNERVLYCESEIQVLRDTIWRLTSRVYQLENFIQKHFGYRTREYTSVSNNDQISSVVTTTPSETPPPRRSPVGHAPPPPSPPQMFPLNVSTRQHSSSSSLTPKSPPLLPLPSLHQQQHSNYGYHHTHRYEANSLYSGLNTATLFHSSVLPASLNPTSHQHSTTSRSLGRSTSQQSNDGIGGRDDESRTSLISTSSVHVSRPHLGITIKTEKDLLGPEEVPEISLQQSVNPPRAYWKSSTATSESVHFEDMTDELSSSHSSNAAGRSMTTVASSSSGNSNNMISSGSSGTPSLPGVIVPLPILQPHSSSSSSQSQQPTTTVTVKPHVCIHCNKKFKRAQELTVHTRIHTGEKPYSCPVCFKKFSQSSSVTLHLPVHTGWKPYKCNICSKAFARLSHMKKHVKNIHGSGTGTHMI